MHYYLTFFLARLAGITHEEALTIALAAQFIDDNDETRPLNLGQSGHINRLSLYHFTQAGYDPIRQRNESDRDYAWRRVGNPSNPQLQNLLSASTSAPTRCARAQLFGEFLHTLLTPSRTETKTMLQLV